MDTRFAAAVFSIALAAAGGLWAQTAPAKVDHSKIVGAWQLEIAAGETNYYLTMNLLEKAGKLEGTLSESSGLFRDLALAEVAFDGEKLSFKFNSPTPPDGVAREIAAEFKIIQGALEGTMYVPDLSVTVAARGRRDTSQKS